MPRRSDEQLPGQATLSFDEAVEETSGAELVDDATVAPFSLGEPARAEIIFPAVLGSLVASACADALGWPTEFMRTPDAVPRRFGVEKLADYVAWRKEVGGRFNTYIDYVGPGEYSDDTQLTLAVARAIAADGSVDEQYFAKAELARWLDYARGAGRTVVAAARGAARKRTPWHLNFFRAGELDYWDSGANGAAMRISPIVLANLAEEQPPFEEVFRNALITHGHPRATVGALALAAALHEVGKRRGGADGTEAFLVAIERWLRDWRPELAKTSQVQDWLLAAERARPGYLDHYRRTISEFSDMLRIVRGTDTQSVLSRLGCFTRATRGSATATVAAAIHLFCRHGANVERAVVEAVNAIPSDTDTIGAFVGSLAGLYGEYHAVPDRWTQRLQDLPYLVALAEALAQIAAREAEFSGTLRARPSRYDLELPDVMELLRSDRVEVDHRVRHDVLGSGWVKAVHAQEIRRRDGGHMVYARVALDIGQQCQFRAYLPARTGAR